MLENEKWEAQQYDLEERYINYLHWSVCFHYKRAGYLDFKQRFRRDTLQDVDPYKLENRKNRDHSMKGGMELERAS